MPPRKKKKETASARKKRLARERGKVKRAAAAARREAKAAKAKRIREGRQARLSMLRAHFHGRLPGWATTPPLEGSIKILTACKILGIPIKKNKKFLARSTLSGKCKRGHAQKWALKGRHAVRGLVRKRKARRQALPVATGHLAPVMGVDPYPMPKGWDQASIDAAAHTGQVYPMPKGWDQASIDAAAHKEKNRDQGRYRGWFSHLDLSPLSKGRGRKKKKAVPNFMGLLTPGNLGKTTCSWRNAFGTHLRRFNRFGVSPQLNQILAPYNPPSNMDYGYTHYGDDP